MRPTYTFQYQTPDGEIYAGDTLEEVVQQMADEKMETPRSLYSYRLATARRISELFGKKIDPSTPGSFIESMVTHDLLKQI